MLTEAQTHYLLSIPKYVIDGNGVQQSSISIDLNVEYKYRLDLRSVIDDVEYNFLLVIDRGKKYTLKLTLHCQDSESKDCIVRIDYNSAHTNPSRVLDTLPDQFCPFAGAIIRNRTFIITLMGINRLNGPFHYLTLNLFPKNS